MILQHETRRLLVQQTHKSNLNVSIVHTIVLSYKIKRKVCWSHKINVAFLGPTKTIYDFSTYQHDYISIKHNIIDLD